MSFTYTIYGKEGDQFSTASGQVLSLGTRMVMKDGRVYRYCKNGATALTAGRLTIVATAIANSTMIHALYAAAAQNATSVKFNTTGSTGTFTASELKDGMIWFSATGATGQAESHLIYKHVAWSTVTGTTIDIMLYPNDKIRNAWATSTGTARLMKNKFRDVIVSAVGLGSGGALVGVPNTHIAANYYFWAQTWGPCPVEYDNLPTETLVVGQVVQASTETAGNVANRNSSGNSTSLAVLAAPGIGSVISVGASTFQALVDLTIAP